MQELKKRLRKELIAKRRALDAEQKAKLDRAIFENLIGCDSIAECSTFLVYASSPIEVDTRMFIEWVLGNKKTAAVPKCVGKEMHFLTISSLNELVKSSFGVDEPISGEEITDFSDTVCIVPALSFDGCGYRLGYGGGFYDRFLSRYSGLSVGICYSDFIGEVPKDIYDRNADMLITENETFIFR